MRELIPASAAFDGQSLFVPSIEKCLLRGYSRAPPVQGFLAMAHLDIVPLRYWVHVSQPDCGASDDRSSFLHGDCVYYLDGLVGNGHRSSWVTVSPLRVAKQEEDEEVSVLEQMRRRRLECREIVEAADGTFEENAFCSVFANVPLIVFIAYGLVSYTEQTEFKKAMGVTALLGALIQVLVITIAATWVHEYVRPFIFSSNKFAIQFLFSVDVSCVW
ncbi:hypothetical protein RvY_10970-2 [Ramazzottius varieornatus]|uniref:Uncharacterized protein n=1 Tax=Ramazzottius varieornatus TaxID=947166 RepID=A0A1D1VEJ4_RAMVA|nr:hypothetical protein RvY_10970-2 [Ramazzottius varieornatus]